MVRARETKITDNQSACEQALAEGQRVFFRVVAA